MSKVRMSISQVKLALCASVMLAFAAPGLAQAQAGDPASSTVAPAADETKPSAVAIPVPDAETKNPRRMPAMSPIDRRVALLAKELKLTGDQQVKVKQALLDQREQVNKLWSDASMASALRISNTQAIADRTADRIRATLTEEQRKQYIQPRKMNTSADTARAAGAKGWITPDKTK